jgi:fumarylacetoacetate (FAA) hydrolase
VTATGENALAGEAEGAVALDPAALAAPLPRAYQWADGSTYLSHVERVRKADLPASLHADPLMYQGGSDGFLGPRDPLEVESEDFGIDLEAEVAVIVDQVPMAAGAVVAADKILLVALVNDVSLRKLIPAELAKGFGFFRTRTLGAGTIVGGGTVSNYDRASGVSCLAELRVLEHLEHGAPRTPFLRFGDRVRIEMLEDEGRSIFGAIDQTVVPYRPPPTPR